MASISRWCMAAIELGTCRSGRSRGSCGSVAVGYGKEQPTEASNIRARSTRLVRDSAIRVSFPGPHRRSTSLIRCHAVMTFDRRSTQRPGYKAAEPE
jgi:hypothetical protein